MCVVNDSTKPMTFHQLIPASVCGGHGILLFNQQTMVGLVRDMGILSDQLVRPIIRMLSLHIAFLCIVQKHIVRYIGLCVYMVLTRICVIAPICVFLIHLFFAVIAPSMLDIVLDELPNSL